MAKINLTEKEIKVLKGICRSDYLGVDPTTDQAIEMGVWMFDAKDYSKLSGKIFSGTCSSLIKKGLIGTDIEGDPMMVKEGVADKIQDIWSIWMTKLGWKEINKVLNKEYKAAGGSL